MKYFFDIYLRTAGGYLQELPWEADGSLNGFHKLELLDAGAKFSMEGQPHALGDGTDLNDGEVADFSAATLWVTKAEWELLRADYHNQKCDILLWDEEATTVVALVYGMQMNVSQLITSGESALIQLAGKRQISNAGAEEIIIVERSQGVLKGIEVSGVLDEFYTVGGTPSDVQSYRVRGIRLNGAISVEAPDGFELSIDNVDWDNPINLDADYDGHVYVRMSGTGSGTMSGNIEHSSAGVQTQNVAVSGVVEVVDYTQPEYLSIVNGAGALWRTSEDPIINTTLAAQMATAEDCVAAYVDNGYGAAESIIMGNAESPPNPPAGYQPLQQMAYSFTPPNNRKTFVLSSGVHGAEATSVAATILLMQLLSGAIEDANTSNPLIIHLRHSVRFIFVPIYNPYGYDIWSKANVEGYYSAARKNARDVDLNRNGDYNWNDRRWRPDHGSAPGSEAENANFLALLEDIGYDNIDFYLDAHDTTGRPNSNGTYSPYMAANNYNHIYTEELTEWMRMLLTRHTGVGGTLPLPASSYYLPPNYYCSFGGVSNVTGEVLNILSAACEHTVKFDPAATWATLDEHITRECELRLAILKLFDKITTEEAHNIDSDWFNMLRCPSLDTSVLNDSNSDYSSKTTLAGIMNLHPDNQQLYTYGSSPDETSVYGIKRGTLEIDAKKLLVVGVASNLIDALVIHRAITELDKYAAKTNLAALLADCSITFVPTANPEGTTIADWASGLEAEAVALRTYAAGFDYVFAIAPHQKDGRITWAANSHCPKIINDEHIEAVLPSVVELTAVSGINGATIYLNNSVGVAYYSSGYSGNNSYRYGDTRHAPLLANYMRAILNGLAAWNCEELVPLADTDYLNYVSTVVADGGTVVDADMVLSRINFLKANSLWDSLQMEYSANYGVKYDEYGNIEKIYNLKNPAHTAEPLDSDSKPTIYEDTDMGIHTMAMGNPSGAIVDTQMAFEATGGGICEIKSRDICLVFRREVAILGGGGNSPRFRWG